SRLKAVVFRAQSLPAVASRRKCPELEGQVAITVGDQGSLESELDVTQPSVVAVLLRVDETNGDFKKGRQARVEGIFRIGTDVLVVHGRFHPQWAGAARKATAFRIEELRPVRPVVAVGRVVAQPELRLRDGAVDVADVAGGGHAFAARRRRRFGGE